MNYILIAWIAGIASIGHGWPAIEQAMWLLAMTLAVVVLFKHFFNNVFHNVFNNTQLSNILKLMQQFSLISLLFCVGYHYASNALAQRLQQRAQQVESISAVFYIAKIGEQNSTGVQQVARRVDQLPEQNYVLQLKPEQLPINASTLQLGQYYAIEGKLKPPHGYAVPNVFDVERWYLAQNWQGRIAVKHLHVLSDTERQQRIQPRVVEQQAGFWPQLHLDIEQLRLFFRQELLKTPIQQRGLMLALLTGDRSLLDPELEQQFQRFGISHLLAISGPHVLLFATMLCWLLSQFINRYRPTWYLWQPRQILLLIPFVTAVVAYAAFVGFEIPALRTLLSVLLIALAVWLKIVIRPLRLILLSAALLLWLDPFSILSAAFWLSYGACFILLRVYQTLQKQHHPQNQQQDVATSTWRAWWLKAKLLWSSQWRIFVALMPVVLWIFGQVAWITPISNMLAIPLLGLLVVPLNLLAASVSGILPPLAQLLWLLADAIIRFLLVCLNWLEQVFDPQLSQWAFTPWHIGCVGLAVFLLFLPRGSVPKFWVLLCIVPLLGLNALQRPVQPQLHIIDVGQGQAILLRDAARNVLIDTGGYYDESRFSIGEKVLLPFLRGQGIAKLDHVILSHLDQDHSGAYPALQRGMPILALQSNEALDYEVNAPFSLCQSGQTLHSATWQLQILLPFPTHPALVHANQNDYSCVVYVRFKQAHGASDVDVKGYRDFLIMGDAGFAAENQLMQRYPHLKVDVLVLGHHGSRHSSSSAFLQHYQPKLTVASAGFNNRYGHPSNEVRQRLQQLNILLLNTAETGNIVFSAEDGFVPKRFRDQRPWLRVSAYTGAQ